MSTTNEEKVSTEKGKRGRKPAGKILFRKRVNPEWVLYLEEVIAGLEKRGLPVNAHVATPMDAEDAVLGGRTPDRTATREQAPSLHVPREMDEKREEPSVKVVHGGVAVKPQELNPAPIKPAMLPGGVVRGSQLPDLRAQRQESKPFTKEEQAGR